MARTAEQILTRIMRHVPSWAAPLRPLFAGVAGAFRLVELALDDLATAVTIGGAEHFWLTLLARGYGVRRADAEPDASLRARLRNVEDMLTRDSIEDAVDAILAPFTASTCTVVEHWDAPHMAIDVSAACDVTNILDANPAFTVFVPIIGGDPNHPVYPAIWAEIRRIKACGVTAYMIVEAYP
jgi:hypothetical protein